MPPRGLQFPALLLVEEKHSPSYFHVESEEALHLLALNILTARLTSGDWYLDPEKHGPPDPCDIDPQKIPEMPQSLRAIAEDTVRDHQHATREFVHDCEQFESIKKAAQEKDGTLAWKILQARADYEYETVRLVPYCRKYHA